MGKQWAAEDPAKRQLFQSMADDIKIQHQRDNPGYCYQPRKPTDKKRRMSKKKAAALANMAETLTSTSTTSLGTITTSTSGTTSATTSNTVSVPAMPISANVASQGVSFSASIANSGRSLA